MQEHRLPQDLPARLKKLGARLALDERVLFAYLFGSVARGRFTPLSDVDLAIHPAAGLDPVTTKLDLLGLAQDTLGLDRIDLVLLDQAPLMLRYRIVHDGKVLAERDHARRLAFESAALRAGWDFLPRERMMLERRFRLGHR
ncbi:MAG: nucleotidyltransferase domain-containing protein [Deltaproteobacteria bacterium]|nr:nucleotidyltransferase domain-containing protein [Deltaproteobacteria bacterium]